MKNLRFYFKRCALIYKITLNNKLLLRRGFHGNCDNLIIKSRLIDLTYYKFQCVVVHNRQFE